MELGDSQVEYVLRAFTSPADAFFVRPALNEQFKVWMEQQKLSIPLAQLQLQAPKMAAAAGAQLRRAMLGLITRHKI